MAFSFVRTIKLVFIVTLKIRLFNTRLKIMIDRDIKKGELIEKTKISWSTNENYFVSSVGKYLFPSNLLRTKPQQ